MTRKDYIAMADELSWEWKQIDSMESANRPFIAAGFIQAVSALCVALKRDNSNFDSVRFMDAVTKS